jgi:CRP/FNR family cyclic AMP-dependent transcriptional regulator
MAYDILGEIPLFATLPVSERLELADMMRPRSIAADETIVVIGEAGNDFYVIGTGNLTVSCPDEFGKEVKLATLSPGSFFGELSLLDGGPRTATVRAETPASVLSLGREDFMAFLSKHPDAAVKMLTILGQRQRDTLDKVRGIRNANEAIAANTTKWEKLAEKLAGLTATREFVLINLIGCAIWIGINMFLRHLHRPGLVPFDQPPTFSVLGLIVTVEALFVTLFVLISQSLQSERDHIRADLEYQVNLKAHQELMQLQQKVDRLAGMVAGSRREQPKTGRRHKG